MFINKHPAPSNEKQISKASFFEFWPKNYTKGKQLTDLCKICYLTSPSYLKKYPNLKEQNKKIVDQHLLIINKTKEYFEQSLKNLDKDKKNAVILFDFKEKFKVGSCNKQIGINFYNQKSVTLLTFCVYYPSNIVKYKKLSKNLYTNIIIN